MVVIILRETRMIEDHVDGLVQERRNSSALAMELRLSCTSPSIWYLELHYISFNNHINPSLIRR